MTARSRGDRRRSRSARAVSAKCVAESLGDAGFTEIYVDAISFEVPLRSAEDLIAGLVEGTVSTGALLRAANEPQGALIRESLEVRLEPWRRGSSYAVPASVKIARGRKQR